MQSTTQTVPIKSELDWRFGYCFPARPDADQRAIDQIDAALLSFPHDQDAACLEYMRRARGFLNAADLPRDQQLNLALQMLCLAVVAADCSRMGLATARAELAIVAVQEARGVHVSASCGKVVAS